MNLTFVQCRLAADKVRQVRERIYGDDAANGASPRIALQQPSSIPPLPAIDNHHKGPRR